MTATTTTVKANPKLAAKFRKAVDPVAKKVAELRAPRPTNTPKRSREAMSRKVDADHLDRVKEALEKLADAHEAGTVPPALAGLGKAELLPMLATKLAVNYYSIADTGEYHDLSERAVALRAFLAASADPKALAEKRRADELFHLEEKVRFSTIPGFFPTPPAVIAAMFDHANVRVGRPLSFLEPSAGKGDLVDAIRAACPDFVRVATFEVSPTLRDILAFKGCLSCGGDFTQAPVPVTEAERVDRVLMNPPFEGGQDIDHVRRAWKWLKDGGRLVSVMSAGPFFRADEKSQLFREWFDEVGGEKYDLPGDAFKDAFRSTGTRTVLVVIDR